MLYRTAETKNLMSGRDGFSASRGLVGAIVGEDEGGARGVLLLWTAMPRMHGESRLQARPAERTQMRCAPQQARRVNCIWAWGWRSSSSFLEEIVG